MNSKYFIAGIGSIIFSINTILIIVLEYFKILIPDIIRDINIYIIFFIIISFAILLMGVGYLEFYLKNRKRLSLFAFIIALSAGSFLLISNSLQLHNYSNLKLAYLHRIFSIPYFELNLIVHNLWGIYLVLITIFFILSGICLITQTNYMKNKDLTLYSGILALIISPLSLIFSSIFFFTKLEQISYLIIKEKIDLITEHYGLLSVSSPIINIRLYFDAAIAYSTYMTYSALLLGFLTILISIIFFLESKNARLDDENQSRRNDLISQ